MFSVSHVDAHEKSGLEGARPLQRPQHAARYPEERTAFPGEFMKYFHKRFFGHVLELVTEVVAGVSVPVVFPYPALGLQPCRSGLDFTDDG